MTTAPNPAEPLIRPLDDAGLSVFNGGGKAEKLARLVRAGFAVPPGFVVTVAAYVEAVNAAAALPDAHAGESIAEKLARVAMPPSLAQAVNEALWVHGESAQRHKDGGGWAVRSSGVSEDGDDASAAGQNLTLLNVRGADALLDAIRQCWLSLYSERSLLYDAGGERSPDMDAALPRMGVVVQALLEPDVAGVLFTANPVTGDRDQMLVSSTWGLGATVVDGGSADTFYIRRTDGVVLSRTIAEKPTMIQAGPEGAADDLAGLADLDPSAGTADADRPKSGVISVAVPERLRERQTVSDAFLAQLAAVGRSVEELMAQTGRGGPQDIEWARCGGTLHLLQARPITTGITRDKNEPPVAVWSNVNVGEALPGVGTPMTWSIIRRFSRMGFEQAFGALGLRVPREYGMVGCFRGRVYLNLSQFMSVASQIPVLSPTRLLSLAGGEVKPGLTMNYRPRSPFGFLARLPVTLPKIGVSQVTAPNNARDWAEQLARERDALFSADLTAQNDSELAATLTHVTEIFNKTGTTMLACASNALSSHVGVSMLLNLWGGEELTREEHLLYTGLSGLASAEPGLQLLRIAGEIRTLGLEALVLETPDDRLRDALSRSAVPAAGQRVLDLIDQFIATYGLRAPREAEIATPRWAEDPAFLFSVLRGHLRSPHLPDAAELERRRHDERLRATAHVRARLKDERLGRLKRAAFDRALDASQEATRLRERLRANVVDTLSMYRHVFLEVGRRATERGQLRERDDVFFLSIGEVHQLLRGETLDLSWKARALLRRLRHEVYVAAEDPPADFELRRGEVAPTPEEAAFDHDDDGSVVIRGLAGSPGVVTGPARVVKDPNSGARLLNGEILVAPYTDIGWTPMFLLAGAVVADLGGPLSHSCIVAREYGIPCVVNAKRSTELIKDGDLITVDGWRGLVYVRRRAGA